MPEPISDLKWYSTLFVLGIITFAVLFASVFCVADFVNNVWYTTPSYVGQVEQRTNTDIISLSDTSLIQGLFFLGCGGISDETYFVYYEGTTSFKLKKVSTDDTTIFMDEEEHPYITEISYLDKYVARNGYVDLQPTWMPHKYEFHVPKGTLVRQYNLDGNV